MNTIAAFGIEFGVTVLVALLVVFYLRTSLHRILVDLCGGEYRARFWLAFSTVLLIGVPAAAALAYRPLPAAFPDALDAFFDMARQLGQNVIGLLAALSVLGVIIAFFALVAPRVPRERPS